MRRIIWLAGLLVLLGGFFIFLSIPPSNSPNGEISQRLYKKGPYSVVKDKISIVDTSRPTSPSGDFEGDDKRVLEGALWKPSYNNGPAPLLIYNHGMTSIHQNAGVLAHFMASHGYWVAAIDFPSSNLFSKAPLTADVINQPADVSFLLDHLINSSRDPEHKFYQQIDPSRIGVLGFSLGGLTTELITFDPRFKDERISAAISIAGPIKMMTKDFFSFADLPFMMISGDQDASVNYENNAAQLLSKNNNSVLVTLKNAGHMAFAPSTASLFRWSSNPDRYFCMFAEESSKRWDIFFNDLANDDYGVNKSPLARTCMNIDKYADAMRPAEQLSFTTISVFSFFQSNFHADETERDRYAEYLTKTFPSENEQVTVAQGKDYRN